MVVAVEVLEVERMRVIQRKAARIVHGRAALLCCLILTARSVRPCPSKIRGGSRRDRPMLHHEHNKRGAQGKTLTALTLPTERDLAAEVFAESRCDSCEPVRWSSCLYRTFLTLSISEEWEQVVELCDEALKLDEDNVKGRLRRARARIELEQTNSAWEDVNAILNVDSSNKAHHDGTRSRIAHMCRPGSRSAEIKAGEALGPSKQGAEGRSLHSSRDAGQESATKQKRVFRNFWSSRKQSSVRVSGLSAAR
eukprot:768163-Hanusia_phi.AAC.1